MTLRKITDDNSVKYVSKVGQSQSEQTLPVSKKRKKGAFPYKLSYKKKRFIKKIT